VRGRPSGSKPDDSPSPETRTPLVSAWIGVVGVLVGAMFGLGGSLLLYLQGNNTQNIAAENRISDIRRTAYSDLVAQTQSVRGTITTFHNQVINGARGQALFTFYNETVSPELVKYARADASVELVSPPNVAEKSRKVSLARDRFSDLVFRSIEYQPTGNDSGLPYTQDEFNSVLADFDRSVREFTTEAKASAL
jgi:hypothetical protein